MDMTLVTISVPTDDLGWFFHNFKQHFDSDEYKIIEHYRPLNQDNLRRDMNEQEKETEPQQ